MDDQTNLRPSLSLRNVNKTFHVAGDRKFTFRSLFSSWLQQGKIDLYKALSDINLDIYPGEFIGIIGHNGSGKSTLLKLIAGIYNADKGSEIEINGRLVPFLELGVGFNPDLTGRENIYLNGTILGMTSKHLDTKVDEIIKFSGLERFINNPVKNFSSGMMVRLAFAIAIQADADIYILDEVLGVGDEAFRRKSEATVRSLTKEGKTIIYVSHELDEVENMCSKVAWVDGGKLRFFGDTHEAIRLYKESIDRQIAYPTNKEEVILELNT